MIFTAKKRDFCGVKNSTKTVFTPRRKDSQSCKGSSRLCVRSLRLCEKPKFHNR